MGMTAAQRERLIKAKSKHAAGAAAEDHQRSQAALRSLEAKDNAAAEKEKIREETVRGAWFCCACKVTTEFEVAGCRLAGHPTKRVTATRRFWECTGCGKREAVLSDAPRMPRVNCARCFNFNASSSMSSTPSGVATWRRCGAGKAVTGAYKPGEGLITSFSEGTSWKDKFSIERDVLDDRH